MARYELKPHNVEAVLFKQGLWSEVVRTLGPHLTKSKESNSHDSLGEQEFYVFDIASKMWLPVFVGQYVVRDEEGAVEVMSKESFEATYQEVRPPSLFPTTPYQPPFGPTYGGHSR